MEAAIDSVSWCDEILVVDSFSTDNTVALAQQKGARVIQREYIHSASQKNWAIPQAQNEWILLLDADERVTPALKQEIQQLLSGNDLSADAYWIKRQNHFMGKRIRYSGWQRDKVIRLFRRDTCRYEDKHVHSEIITDGKIGKLKNALLHYTFRDMAHYLEKWDRYSTWSAQDAAGKTGTPNFYHFVIKPGFRFWKHYIIDLGILDGYTGFIVCSLAAKGVFMRYVKLYAIRMDERSKKIT